MKLQNHTNLKMDLDWADLRLFLEIARHARLAEAARRLRIDPTTLGRRLRRFEKELGADLFERTAQGYRLTPKGQALAAYAEQMEHASLKALEMIGGAGNAASGTVRISAAEGFGTNVIAPALGAFSRLHPEIEIDLVATSGFLSVSKREADIAILLTRPTTGRLFVRRLSHYALMLYASRHYLKSSAPIRAIDDLRDHRLIGYVDDLVYSPKLRYLDELPVELTPAIRSSSIIAQLQATKAGAGLCILPCFMADTHRDLVRVLPGDISIQRTFWLAVHEDIREAARIRAACDMLGAAVEEAQGRLLGTADT